MVNKGILLFDIDKTIFDTDKTSASHNEHVLRILNTTDIEKIKKIKEEYRSTLKNEREYKPEDYLKLLVGRFDFKDLDSLLDIYYGDTYKFIYKEAVYPDTIPVLDSLQNKYRLGIYSEGTKKFQNHKFRSMDLSNYFDESLIFIVDAKDTAEVIAKIPQESIIVDDKEIICEFLSQNKIRTIWINKKDDRKSDKFTTISSLLELTKIL